MSTPEKRQALIISRKLNFMQIEALFKEQLELLPTLSEDNQLLLTSALNIRRDVRSVISSTKDLKKENDRLTAKRRRQKLEWDKMNKKMNTLNNKVTELTKLIQQNECDIDNDMEQYNKKLIELANQYRQSFKVYDEEHMNREYEKSKKILSDLQAEEKFLQEVLADARNEFDGLEASVPENILEIVSEKTLEEI